LNATVSSDHILISWPSTFTGYTLETKSTLATANWDIVATAPIDDGTNWTITLDRQFPTGFFRLRLQ
jgi:hypothetical protein